MIRTPNLIIGAGPAGMSVAGRLCNKGLPFEIIEKDSQVSPSWRRHYDRLHLHTAKDLSNLPHLNFPDHYPVYVSREDFVKYMESYMHHFNIQPHFGTEAKSVKQVGDKWVTETSTGQVFESDNLIIGTGFNRVPNMPSWPGLDSYEGFIQHSCFYKNGKDLRGKKVLLVGMGNTGAELAIDLHECGAEPFISARNPVNIVLRDFNGKPTQYTAIKLQKLPNWLSDAIAVLIQKIMIGDLSKYGLKRPTMSPSAQLRELGKTPVIDLGTVELIKKGLVKIKPGIERFTPKGVVFTDGESMDFDALFLATGYKSQVDDFLVDMSYVPNHLGEPKSHIIPERKGLYFIGFEAYAGGLLRSIFLNSELIVKDILKSK